MWKKSKYRAKKKINYSIFPHKGTISDHGHSNGGKQREWNCNVHWASFVNELEVIVDLFRFTLSWTINQRKFISIHV